MKIMSWGLGLNEHPSWEKIMTRVMPVASGKCWDIPTHLDKLRGGC